MSVNEPYEAAQPFGRPGAFRCMPYFVRGGDTLNGLSAQYGVSSEALIRANPNLILQRGQNVCIPRRRF